VHRNSKDSQTRLQLLRLSKDKPRSNVLQVQPPCLALSGPTRPLDKESLKYISSYPPVKKISLRICQVYTLVRAAHPAPGLRGSRDRQVTLTQTPGVSPSIVDVNRLKLENTPLEMEPKTADSEFLGRGFTLEPIYNTTTSSREAARSRRS